MTPKWIPGHLYLPGDLVQPIQSAAPVSTALTNPGFESGVITGWTVTTSGAGTSSVASDKKYAGTYAGRWQGVGGGASADWVNDTEVPVTPGQSVSAAMYLSMDDTGSSANQARSRLYWYDASHAPLSHTDGLLIHGNTSAWYASPVTGVAPASAAYCRMGVWTTANASGGVRVDNASWSIVAAATPAGLIYKAVQTGPGTSASSEPTWPSTLGATVVDGTVTWEALQASRVVWEASPICLSGATEPTWPTDVGGFVTDGTISWECISRRVEDPKCPNSTVVAILAGKVFAADGDIVRFSATANPLDWSSADDAGYLPTGLQQANANDMAVLNQYRSNLVAFNASSFQNWQADPDPAAMAILDQMDGIGSTWQHAAQPVANDLFFLSQLGVRSVGIAAGADNLSAGDIGMPIDVLVREALRVAIANGTDPLATYYPGAGQYWLAFSNYPTPGVSIGGNLPNALVGATVEGTYVATGGVGAKTFAVTSGALPDGLTLASDGSWSGVATGEGNADAYWDYAWQVTATDEDGNTAALSDTSRITNFTLSGNVASGLVGDSQTGTYSANAGVGAITYAVTAGTFPAGLALATNGSWSGAYTTVASYSWTITGTDTHGNSATLDDAADVALAGQWWLTAGGSSDATRQTQLWTSPDLASWSGPYVRSPNINATYGPVSAGDAALIANTSGGTERITDFVVSDGVTTVPVTIGSSSALRFIRSFPGLLFTSDQSGPYWLSVDDGATWTQYASPSGTVYDTVDLCKLDTGRWLTVSYDPGGPRQAWYSDQLVPTTWVNAGSVGQGECLVSSGTAAVLWRGGGTAHNRTTTGSGWASLTTAFTTTSNPLGAYGNGVFVMNGSAGKIARSTNDGASFAEVALPAGTDVTSVRYDNGVFLVTNLDATGANHLHKSADLGLTWSEVTLPYDRTSSTAGACRVAYIRKALT